MFKKLFGQSKSEDDASELVGGGDNFGTPEDFPVTETKPRKDTIIKILAIGDSGCGKTSILDRYCTGKFKTNTAPTIGVDFLIKNTEVGGAKVKCHLIDSVGQQMFRSITFAYYRGVHAVMIVFDVTSTDSFDNLRDWISNVKQYAQEDVVVVVIGNKVDVPQRIVTTYEASEFCKKHNFKYFETSAKEGTNIDQAFNDAISQVQNNLSF
jgi:small GTP-binding protein